MDEEFFEKLKEKVMPYFEGTNPCHDFNHVKRVLKLALIIGKKESADLDIIKTAVLLHDIARKEQDDSRGKICHAKRGAEIAKQILEEMGFLKDKIGNVVHCIRAHRFRGDSAPETIEAKVLCDADNLDAIGAIGILRAASFSGFTGAVVHNPDVNIKTTTVYSKDDSAYREFLDKLIRIKDKMLTQTGREFAKERQDFMNEFFDRANKEVRGEL